MVAHSNRKTRTTQAGISVKKIRELLPESQTLNENIFSELSLRDLGEKKDLGGLETRTKE